MKILLITQDFPPRPGGMARYYADWARGLGERCTVAVGDWEGAPPRTEGSFRLLRLPFDAARSHRWRNLRRCERRVREHLRREPDDILVAGNVRPFGPLVLGLSRRTGLPFAVVYHGNDLLRTARRWRRHWLRRRSWRAILSSARLHITNSAYTASLAEELGFPPSRIAVVPPEVDTARFHPARTAEEREALRRERGWEEDVVVSLFVGRLVPRKGLQDLFAALPALDPRVRLVVAGHGAVAPWRRQAETEGVADRVEFLGAVPDEDLPRLYRAADIFVAPSRDRRDGDDVEGFGIVFLEAAASGLPALGTGTGGIPEAVEDGTGGLLVPSGDVPRLAEAWRSLAADPALRRRLGQGGLTGRARTHGPGTSARRLLDALARARPG